MINAEVHSDDYLYEVEFDATRWFEQASDKEIIDLVKCGWGGDYPADAVACFFGDDVFDIKCLFVYIEKTHKTKKHVGYECHVNQEEAIAWIAEHRSHLIAQLNQIED